MTVPQYLVCAARPADAASRAEARELVYRRLHQTFGVALDPRDRLGLTVIAARDRILDVLRFLRDEPDLSFDTLLDVVGIDYLDYPGHDDERFSVIWNLRSQRFMANRVRVRVWVSEENPAVPSSTSLWPIADWLERETWDQYGIRFEGHPNLVRLLNHVDFEGHPLRKDYPFQRRQELSANDPLATQLVADLTGRGWVLPEGLPGEAPEVEDPTLGRRP